MHQNPPRVEASRKGLPFGGIIRWGLSASLLALAFIAPPAFAQPATCVVSGTVLDGGAQPIVGTVVRFRVISPVLASTGAGLATQDLTTRTAADGTWSLTLVQGLNAQVDIPSVGIAKDTVIPTGASCPAAFTALTLYNRGTLTPATILSTVGPSMGGDLTGASPNPSVIALRGQPLAVGACTNGQARVYSSGTSSYTCQAVASGVTSVSAGTGISVTGTASVPIVGITAGGVAAASLGVSAAATNVGTLTGVLSGTLPSPGMAAGAAAANVGALSGALSGTLPAPSLAVGSIVNADVNAAAGIAWTKVSKAGAVPGDIGAENPSNKGAIGGYAPLDGASKVPLANLPTTPVHATTHATGGTDPITAASITAANLVHNHAEGDTTGLVADLADKLSKGSGGTVTGPVVFNGAATFNSTFTIPGSFAPASGMTMPRLGDATLSIQTKNSNNLVFEGSVWNVGGAVAEKRLLALKNTPTGFNAGKLSFLGYSTDNVIGSELAFIDGVTGAFNGPLVGNSSGTHTGAVVGNVTGNASGTAASFTGNLAGDVTSAGMTTAVALVGGSTAAAVNTATVAANSATALNTASKIVARDATNNFAAGTITANLTGNVTGALTGNATTASDGLTSASGTLPLALTLAAKGLTGTVADATTLAKGAVQLAGDLNGTAGAPGVATVGGQTAANVAAGAALANAATSANTPSAIVKRDISGNFTAGTITAALTGAATSFSGSLVGDVTGTQGATNVVKLQGRNVSNAIPANTNVLGWVALNNDWEPIAGGGGGGAITSVNASGGTTGLSFTGGPITAGAGVLTLGGTLGIGNGGTGATTIGAAFNALSPMTFLGDVIYGGTSGAGTRLGGNLTTTPMFLKSVGVAGLATAPLYQQINAATDLTGVLPVANGGTANTTGSAATLTTPRAINGVNFDGSTPITVPAAAGTLTGTTLAAGVTASSLTSVGTLGTAHLSGTLSLEGALQNQLFFGNVNNASGANSQMRLSWDDTTHRLQFDDYWTGTPRLVILNGGNVGIGTTGPGFPLVVEKDVIAAVPTTSIQLQNSTLSTAVISQQFSPSLQFTGHAWNTTAVAADNQLDAREYLSVTSAAIPTSALNWGFQRAGGGYTDQLTLTSAGNLGIGTTAPTSALTVTNVSTSTSPTVAITAAAPNYDGLAVTGPSGTGSGLIVTAGKESIKAMHGGSAIANPWSPGSALFASSAASNAPSAVFKNGASGNTAPTVYLEAIANQTTDLIRTVGTGTGASGSGWDSAGHIYFSGDLQSQSARMTMGASTEAITLSTIGTTTDSTANLLPANSVIRGITVFVDESITVASAFSVGDATIAARFLATGTGLVFGSTAVGLACVDQTGTSGPKQTAAAKVRITTTGTPTAGIVRVTVFYETFRAPLS